MDYVPIIEYLNGKEHSLVILIGPVGCGKTTISKYLKEHLYPEYEIISPEKIRKELNYGTNDITNKDIFAKVYDDLVTGLKNGKNIIYDATNCKVQYRRKIINMCKPYCDYLVGIVNNDTLINCLKKNKKYKNPIDNSVIEDTYISLRKNPPHIFEGYNILFTF